jgi:hypothetical protein
VALNTQVTPTYPLYTGYPMVGLCLISPVCPKSRVAAQKVLSMSLTQAVVGLPRVDSRFSVQLTQRLPIHPIWFGEGWACVMRRGKRWPPIIPWGAMAFFESILIVVPFGIVGYSDLDASDVFIARTFFVMACVIVAVQVILLAARRRGQMPFVVVFLACGVIGMVGLAAVNYVDQKRTAKSRPALQGNFAGSAPNVLVYEAFRRIRESYPQLGSPLSKEEPIENPATRSPYLYLAEHQCAYVIWDRKFFQLALDDCDDHKSNTWARVADVMDQGESPNLQIGKEYGDGEWLKEHFKDTPVGLFPPFGGVAQGFDRFPKKWLWVGYRRWHVALCGVMKQEFEGGRIYGPVPIHRGANDNLEALILLYENKTTKDKGTWDYQEITGIKSPRAQDAVSAKACWLLKED